tara:strand:+ start:1108 stop:1245 length:138 start_codon:yes stop_codon:yes gene_type:complete
MEEKLHELLMIISNARDDVEALGLEELHKELGSALDLIVEIGGTK